MSTGTMFDAAAPLARQLEGTAFDPEKGRQREFRVIFALTFATLLVVFALVRLLTFAGSSGPRPSIWREARAATSAALGYAYRY